MKIVTNIIVAMFIVFIILPFILLCSVLMINLMLEIFHDLKKHFQEIIDEKEKK